MPYDPKRSTPKPAPKRRAGRSYDRAGRLIKIPPSPGIKCRIVDNITDGFVMNEKDGGTVFKTKSKAKVALWKLCETLPKKASPEQPDRYSIVTL